MTPKDRRRRARLERRRRDAAARAVRQASTAAANRAFFEAIRVIPTYRVVSEAMRPGGTRVQTLEIV